MGRCCKRIKEHVGYDEIGRRVDLMNKEDLQRIAAVDAKQSIKNQIMTIYERNNIPNLNGFKLTWDEICKDTEGLEDEIMELMKHPRKYKAMLKVIRYFNNMM